MSQPESGVQDPSASTHSPTLASPSSSGPLASIRVLDMGTMLAGPYGATLLGDLGADVIKVESHQGDASRHLGPERDGERSPFLSLNRSKRAIVLDLRLDRAQEVFARLVATTDILITTIREPALSQLGLRYDQVKAHRPDLIWIGVSAFGSDGPYAGRPGIDFLAQAYAGLISLNGAPGTPLTRLTVPLVDVMTSLLVSTAAVSALHARSTTGKGQQIDVSLLDALVHAQASGLGSYLTAGEVTPRTGNRSMYFAPSGIFPCADGKHAVITCPSDKFFRNLCRALECDWDHDPRFATIPARLEHQDDLEAQIAKRTATLTRDDLIERLIAADVLTAPVNETEEVVRDPQILHNRMIVETPHARLGSVRVTGVPIHFHGTPAQVASAPPLQGHHTEEILAELGYDAEEVMSLRKERAVATPRELDRGKRA